MKFAFKKGNCELTASRSRAIPNSIIVLVVGPTEQDVQTLIEQAMVDGGAYRMFSAPLACPDGQWSSFGRVSQ